MALNLRSIATDLFILFGILGYGSQGFRTTTPGIWTEEGSLAPLGEPQREDLPLCDNDSQGGAFNVCLHRSPEALNWSAAHNYCRSKNGFLASRSQYPHLSLWWPEEWWVDGNLTWTALTSYMGHYQWLSQSPARSDFVKWLEPPKNWSRDCASFNLTTSLFQLTDCLLELNFFCVLDDSKALPDIDFSDVELKVTSSVKDHHELIKVSEDEFNDLVLTCQAFSRSTKELLPIQPHIFWRKDNVYIDHNVTGLQPSTVFDSSKSEAIVPGAIEKRPQKELSQGTFWCESWIPYHQERLTSNRMLLTLEEWVTLIFHAHRNEPSESDQDTVKTTLARLFSSDFPGIINYTWDLISAEKKAIENSSDFLAKYRYHVHMPRHELAQDRMEKVNFKKRFDDLLRHAKFLDTSNLTFATFCYKQRKSFGSGKQLSWPFTEAGNVYPNNYKCKIKYGKLSPGVCKADYINGAFLAFDPSPCDWLDQCPVGFKYIRNSCMTLSSPANWDTGFGNIYKTSQEKSILSKKSVTNYVKDFVLQQYNKSKIWLPMKREHHLGPFIFQGPEGFVDLDKSGFPWLENHPRSDQDCMALDLDTNTLQTSDCNEKLPFLAIIDIRDSAKQGKSSSLTRPSPRCTDREKGTCLCPTGWNSTVFKGENETCFKLFTNTVNVTWEEANNFCSDKSGQLPTPNVGFLDWVYRQHLYENNIPSVWMGVKWIPDRFVYNGTEDYVNWLPNTDYNLHYGTLTKDGWILEDNETVKQNILCQQIIHQNMLINFQVNEPKQKESQTMCIDVNPIEMLMNEDREKNVSIKCFHNGDILVPEHKGVSGCQYELKVNGQGYYHCKAWARPPYKQVKSNTVLHRDVNTHTFVITLSLNEEYNPEKHDSHFDKRHDLEPNSDICLENIRKYLETSILNQRFRFSPTLIFYTPNESAQLLFNFHLECEIKNNDTIDENQLLGVLEEYLSKKEVLQDSECAFHSIRSTLGCGSDITLDYTLPKPRNLTWPETTGHKIVASEELCITPEGDPVTRECLGDFLEGFYWGSPSQNCSGKPSTITKNLWELNKGEINQTTSSKLASLTSNQTLLLPVDIYLVAKAFRTLSEDEAVVYNFDDIVRVLSNVMGANATSFESVQRKLNSSSTLLEAFEELTFKVELSDSEGDQQRNSSEDLIAVERLDLEANSTIIGFKSQGYSEEKLLVGYRNEDLANADVAIILPNNLTYSVSSKALRKPKNDIILEREQEKVKVAFAVFQNEKLFQDNISYVNYSVNSRIIMASYKGEMIKDLDEPVKILFKPLKMGNNTKCVYWDFVLNNKRGGWSDKGCIKGEREGQLDVCFCNHLTNFAQLINYDENSGFEGTHALLLDIFTIIGCCLSILGLLLVFTTFFLFKKWRRSLSNKILVNLSFSVFCSMVIFLAGINQTWNPILCRSVAVGLHYFILASFGWMLVEAVHQYLKFVKVVGTYIPRFLWKASVCAWGIPLIPILFVLIYDHSLYDSRKKEYNDEFRICWMSVEGFKYAFLPPLVLTMTVNLIMYSLIIHGAICGRARVNSTMSERTLFMNQLRMAVCVFILLGFTWIFGLLAVCQLRQVFSYLFCIFNTLQGFFLFLCHICREQGARKYWKDFLSVFTKDPVSSTPGNSFNQFNSHYFRGHPDSVSFDKCGGILVLPQGPPLRPHLRRTNRTSILSSRTNSTLLRSRASFIP